MLLELWVEMAGIRVPTCATAELRLSSKRLIIHSQKGRRHQQAAAQDPPLLHLRLRDDLRLPGVPEGSVAGAGQVDLVVKGVPLVPG